MRGLAVTHLFTRNRFSPDAQSHSHPSDGLRSLFRPSHPPSAPPPHLLAFVILTFLPLLKKMTPAEMRAFKKRPQRQREVWESAEIHGKREEWRL